MKVSVFGLGYVGAVSAACFAKLGHRVIGVDVTQLKVDRIRAGESPILEPGVPELISEVTASGCLDATSDAEAAVLATDLSLICVGTPSLPNGSIDLSYVERVASEIGAVLADKASPHTVVVRSTVLPGTIDGTVIPALEAASGKRHGVDFFVVSNPEFLREGSSIRDFFEPPFTLIGAPTDAAAVAVKSLYAGVDAPVHVVAVRTAEMVKYVCNAYHALKVSFANEVGNICKALEIDSHDVMRVFASDTKLNISAAYLKPGFAFGGSCLPKDARALTYKAGQMDVATPILKATLTANQAQVERALEMVLSTGHRSVGLFGLSFKDGTDDLRESPLVALAELLIGKGRSLRIYDPFVRESGLLGSNRAYIEEHIPHVWSLLEPDAATVANESETLVIASKDPDVIALLGELDPGKIVIDLVRAVDDAGAVRADYRGICW